MMSDRLPGYELEGLLARGGQGEAWSAWRTAPSGTNERVVITLIAGGDPAVAAMARRVAALRHPGVVRVHEVIEGAWGVGIVSEHHPAGTLRGLLDARGVLTVGEVITTVVDLAHGLTALHQRGLVHGDVTPSNIVLSAAGAPVLIDVGTGAASTPTAAAPAYLDPHVAFGGRPDPAGDLYSLAVVAYEALSGRVPHDGPPREAMAAARAGAHRPLGSRPGVPADLGDIVEGALAPNRSDRHPDLPTLASRLVGWAAAEGIEPARPRSAAGPRPVAFGPIRDRTVEFGPTEAIGRARPL